MTIAHHGHDKAAAPSRLPASAGGTAELLTPHSRSRRVQQLAEAGYLIARVVPSLDGATLGPGGLREAIEAAVEISLALRGALPPAVSVDAPAMAMARDQLFRVRTLEAPGLCLVLPELRRLAVDGALGADDSEALAVWKALAASAPVVVLLDADDHDVHMLAPQALGEVFGHAPERPQGWPDDARAAGSAPAFELDDDDDDGDFRCDEPDDDDDVAAGDEEAPDHHQVFAVLEGAAEIDDTADPALAVALADEDDEDDDRSYPELRCLEEALQSAPALDKPKRDDTRVMPHDPLLGIDEIDDEALPMQTSLFERVDEELQQTVSRFSQPPAPPMAQEMVQLCCDELDEASGPRPVKVIEELFIKRYTPLCEALARGLKDDVARAVVDDWRSAFDKSYSDGFTAMKVTGKRPAMVLDAPEIATRIARINGARAVQLLLVDGMRYDLGQRVLRDLKQRLADTAVCVDENLLWSALPSITPVQMHLLARGARALREEPTPSEREAGIHRNQSVTTLRRVRIGHRDLVKLDVVEARLRDAGGKFDDRLDSIAGEVSEVIAHYAESLAPRTLLYVFGDHGFKLPVRAAGTTGPAEQGGASPEEVLVGAQAWLVGDVH